MSAARRRRPLAGGALVEQRDAGLPTSPAAKLALVVEILATYRRARLLLRRVDLAAAVDLLAKGPPARPADGRDRVIALRLARAVSRTLRLPRADSRCLIHSLVLMALLARRGIECSLAIGARTAPAFAAHAWVEHMGEPLLPHPDYPALVRLFGRGAVS